VEGLDPPMTSSRRAVFFISDRTGITVEMLGNSLLTQFDTFEFHRTTIPFVDSLERVDEAIREINRAAEADGSPPIVFSSLVDTAMSERLAQAKGLFLDFFQIFIAPLEAELGAKSSHAAGRSHGIPNSHEYFTRIDSVNFALAHDDGMSTRELNKAQVVLVGVSRCGKTPTSLYLALQFGVRTANFPLTPDDFVERKLPASVRPYRSKLYGLTIKPERLHRIRTERRPDSHYASLENCRYELREAEAMMDREGIPYMDTSTKSIEEISTTILHQTRVQRRVF
jgi:hypothetical protein